MDQDTKDLVEAASAGTVEAFINVVGAALAELNQLGVDLIRFQRLKTQLKIWGRAKEMCEDAGIEPRAINVKLLVPLLDNMSLEDDPDLSDDPEGAAAMQERWAALLANAIGDDTPDVMPSFPRILSEITAPEAEILDFLSKREPYRPAALETVLDAVGVTGQEAYDPKSPARNRVLVQLGNLERLGLCDVQRPDRELIAVMRKLSEDLARQLETNTIIEMTQLGQAFIVACTPPAEAVEAETTT